MRPSQSESVWDSDCRCVTVKVS